MTTTKIPETTGIRYSVGPTGDGRLQIVITAFGVFDSPIEVADYLSEQGDELEQHAAVLKQRLNRNGGLSEETERAVAA